MVECIEKLKIQEEFICRCGTALLCEMAKGKYKNEYTEIIRKLTEKIENVKCRRFRNETSFTFV